MIVLKAQGFADRNNLTLFVNENSIGRADILIITDGPHGNTIYFYADSEKEETTLGWFS